MNRCVIICASPYNQPQFIKSRVKKTDYIICADGGFDTAVKCGITPDVVIGDFDSAENKINNKYKKIVLPTEKDDTDSTFCVKYAISQGYKDFLILGATGCRADHMYANFSLLKYIYSKGCTGVIEDEYSCTYYTESNLTLHCNSKTVSVLPFGCENAVVSLNGFKYRADKLNMSSDFPIGVSNIAESDNSTVTVHNGGVLIIVIYSKT